MIIDFHTHVFPEKIAEKALKSLSDSSRAVPYTDGTINGRSRSMKEAGIEYCVNLAVATKANQVSGINDRVIEGFMDDYNNGIIQFGAMHAEFEDVKNELNRLATAGIKES